ncbi:hypothetical protein KCMC57_up51970 [Kitasatospora sp. CMC57]|uniref:Uncharacterized protein n=1 Tax=Kitasatospora sp. CMC57 TaxID=3231513 RepID=A0AB33K033_9ACTN
MRCRPSFPRLPVGPLIVPTLLAVLLQFRGGDRALLPWLIAAAGFGRLVAVLVAGGRSAF